MTELIGRDVNGEFEIALRTYPDGMPLVTERRVPSALLLRPSSLGEFMATMFYVDALAARGHAVPSLILPCVPGARQDRVNDDGDFLFTAKSVASEINARCFPRVVVLDPHSDVAPALIDRCTVIHATFVGDGYAGVISPDAGAEKRAGRIAKALGVPLLHGWKSRNVATGAISGFGVQPLDAGAHYLVADDLCDAGGTFLGLAAEIAKRGATADLYVTHGLFTAGTDALRVAFRTVYCTDSTVTPKPGVTVLPRCTDLLRDHA